VAASSKKFVAVEGNDKVEVSPKIIIAGRDAYEGEVVLCFQLDEREDQGKRVPRCLGIRENDPRCDGLVFYSQDGEKDRVVCLVEMKSTNITEAAKQIISTKEHIEKLLREECISLPEEFRADCQKQITRIQWKACLYHNSSSPDDVHGTLRTLKSNGFEYDRLTRVKNNLRPLLQGDVVGAKELASKYKPGKQKKYKR
jgi:hypothetical protein